MLKRRLMSALVCVLAGALLLPTAAFADARVARLGGQTRYDTMAKVVTEGFADHMSSTIVVASGDTWPDSLSSASLAGACKAPIVLTSANSLSPEAKEQIERLKLPTNDTKVYVIGGPSAVSDEVLSQISQIVPNVQRVAGNTRVETSLVVAAQASGQLEGSGNASDTVIIASAANYPDGLSASAFAWVKGCPVLLVNSGQLPADMQQFISNNGFSRAVVMGGPSAVSNDVDSWLKGQQINVIRMNGSTRYETSKLMAEFCLGEGMVMDGAVWASGENFPDALAGGPLAGVQGAPIVLLNPSGDASSLQAASGSSICYLLGGTAVLPEIAVDAIIAAMETPMVTPASEFVTETDELTGGLRVTNYTGDAADVVVPAEIDDKPVTDVRIQLVNNNMINVKRIFLQPGSSTSNFAYSSYWQEPLSENSWIQHAGDAMVKVVDLRNGKKLDRISIFDPGYIETIDVSNLQNLTYLMYQPDLYYSYWTQETGCLREIVLKNNSKLNTLQIQLPIHPDYPLRPVTPNVPLKVDLSQAPSLSWVELPNCGLD